MLNGMSLFGEQHLKGVEFTEFNRSQGALEFLLTESEEMTFEQVLDFLHTYSNSNTVVTGLVLTIPVGGLLSQKDIRMGDFSKLNKDNTNLVHIEVEKELIPMMLLSYFGGAINQRASHGEISQHEIKMVHSAKGKSIEVALTGCESKDIIKIPKGVFNYLMKDKVYLNKIIASVEEVSALIRNRNELLFHSIRSINV